eukprot:Platyproteum_vivax@DN686_c0_g1_i1.p2
MLIGINGCSLKTEENLAVVKKVPIEKILLETDAPWCEMKHTHASFKFVRSQFKKAKKPGVGPNNTMVKGRNEPACLIQVAEAVFGLHNDTFDLSAFQNFCKTIYHNTHRVFPKLRMNMKRI